MQNTNITVFTRDSLPDIIPIVPHRVSGLHRLDLLLRREIRSLLIRLFLTLRFLARIRHLVLQHLDEFVKGPSEDGAGGGPDPWNRPSVWRREVGR